MMCCSSASHSLRPDRKSTRLNSSHSQISYAVFCLKKQNQDESLQTIYNSFAAYTYANGNLTRRPLPHTVLPTESLDPVALKLMSHCPNPTGSGDPIAGLNNFTKNGTSSSPAYK